MKKNFFLTLFLGVASVMSAQETITVYQSCDKNVVDGAIQAKFSVAKDKYVYFSKGNLQFNAAQGTHACADGTTQPGTWRFAENQWDYVGADNKYISESYDGWIDLFGWGTSGWNSGAVAYQPYSTSTTNTDYYPGSLTGGYAWADWGVYNAISNGGNQPGLWRTLNRNEWYTLLARQNASLSSLATVNGVSGLIILPDNWVHPEGIAYTATTSNDTTNTYTAVQWATLEAAGAVFLPAAGCRYGTFVEDAGKAGYYWSSWYYYSNYAYCLKLSSRTLDPEYSWMRCEGTSVRLVQDVK